MENHLRQFSERVFQNIISKQLYIIMMYMYMYLYVIVLSNQNQSLWYYVSCWIAYYAALITTPSADIIITAEKTRLEKNLF